MSELPQPLMGPWLERIKGNVRLRLGASSATIAASPISTPSGGLSEAIAGLSASDGVVYLSPGTYTIHTSNYTIPSYAHVVFAKGAVLSIATGLTVTINGTVEAGLYQIFDLVGTATVVFGRGTIKEAYPQWWGAKGDNANDDTTSLQAAIDTCQASSTILMFPRGQYLISSGLTISEPDGFMWAGEPYRSVIQATEIMSKMLEFSSGATSARFYMFGIWFYGADKADYGIYGLKLTHTTFEQCFVTDTLESAILFSNGWDVDFVRCTLKDNAGDGITANTNINAVNIGACKIYNNDGIGIRLSSGNSVNIEGCTIELNAACGVFAFAIRALTITNNYFEGNGGTGLGITDPEVFDMKTDIFLNGTGVTTLRYTNPCRGVTINGNLFDPVAGNIACIFNNAVDMVTIEDNNNTSVTVPLIESYGHRDFALVWGMHIGPNQSTNIFSITRGFGAAGAQSPRQYTHTWHIDYVQQKNYFDQNILSWGIVSAGVGGGILRDGENFRGYPAARIYKAGSSSHIFGVELNIADDYPELLDELIWFGVWYRWYSAGVDTNVALFTNITGADTIASVAAPSEWRFKSILVPISAGTTIQRFGMQKVGAGNSFVQVAHPIIAPLGIRNDEFELDKIKVRFGGAVPATGIWERGDVAWDSTPTAAAVPGWICVSSGSFSVATDNTGDTDGATAVITGMADTSDFFKGDFVNTSAGFPSSVDAGNYAVRILSTTAATITIDDTSDTVEANITVDTPDPVFKAMAALAA